MTISQEHLFAHEPSSLRALLREQMPYTISLLATVLANSPTSESTTRDAENEVRPALPPLYATFPPRSEGGEVDLAYLESLGIGAHDWLVIVALPTPSEQLRFYHSLVSAPASYRTDKSIRHAEGVVARALREMAEKYPKQRMVGDTHELFERAVRELVGGPKRSVTYTYLAPNGGFGPTDVGLTGDDSWKHEFVLDTGRPEDAELIYSTNPYRLPAYYASRSSSTTVLRPRTDDSTKDAVPPEVWVMTHGDGSLGALWTQPAYRRRGLSKVVLAAHLATTEARGIPGFCHVEAGNAASMGLWESLGWRRLPWTSSWVYEDREKRS